MGEQEFGAIAAGSADLIGLAAEVEAALGGREDVISVRPGYRRTGGRLTMEPAIVVAVRRKLPADLLAAGAALPSELGGIPVPIDVVQADPREILGEPVSVETWRTVHGPAVMAAGAVAEAAAFPYQPPPDTPLDPLEVRDVTFHVGPDAGWNELRPFLADTQERLTVAMYDYTAPWILDVLLELATKPALPGRPPISLAMVLQPPNDEREKQAVQRLTAAWGARLDLAEASVRGPNRLFANAYHTKVAVRDGTALWHSSGNWSPRSQPIIPPGPNPTIYLAGNREWHAIVRDEPLARLYEAYIRWDLAQARLHPAPEFAAFAPDLLVPMEAFFGLEQAVVQPAPFDPFHLTAPAPGAGVRVRPLMTPDNFADGMIALIDSAQHTLFMQHSYVNAPRKPDRYRDLVAAVGRRMQAGVDVRVLTGKSLTQADLDLMISLGWKIERMRRMTAPLHNKGFLVDGRTCVVGSHNWSGDGTQANRDSSMIWESAAATEYFDRVFQFDWTNLTRNMGVAEVTPMIADPAAPTPSGMVRIAWRDWYGAG